MARYAGSMKEDDFSEDIKVSEVIPNFHGGQFAQMRKKDLGTLIGLSFLRVAVPADVGKGEYEMPGQDPQKQPAPRTQ